MSAVAWSEIAVVAVVLAVFTFSAWHESRRIPVLDPDAVTGPDEGGEDE